MQNCDVIILEQIFVQKASLAGSMRCTATYASYSLGREEILEDVDLQSKLVVARCGNERHAAAAEGVTAGRQANDATVVNLGFGHRDFLVCRSCGALRFALRLSARCSWAWSARLRLTASRGLAFVRKIRQMGIADARFAAIWATA